MKTLFPLIIRIKSLIPALVFLLLSAASYAQSTTWTGNEDSQWENAANWTNGVPDASSDATIPSSAILYPYLSNGTYVCNNLTVEDEALLTIDETASLSVAGDVFLGTGKGVGAEIFIQGGLLNYAADFTVRANSELHIENALCTNLPDVNFETGSACIYFGTDFEICNRVYKNLVIAGHGTAVLCSASEEPTVCQNLTVKNTGVVFIIEPGKALTCNGDFINEGGPETVIIKSDENGTGSLITNTDASEMTAETFLTGMRWHYVGSPLTNVDLDNYPGLNFYQWEASMLWYGGTDSSPWQTVSDDTLTNGRGYACYTTEGTITAEGKTTVSPVTATLSMNAGGDADNQGWNLISNPYTAAINWDLAYAGGAVPSGAESAVYFFDDDDQSGNQSNYKYYVPSGGSGGDYGIGTAGSSGIIPVGQAFFIKTNTDNVDLVLQPDYRQHASAEFYKRQTKNVLRLELSNNEYSDEAIFRMTPYASSAFDPDADARKRFATDEQMPRLYFVVYPNSHNISADQEPMYVAINSIDEKCTEPVAVLGIKGPEGIYNLTVKEADFAIGTAWLYDNYTKKAIEMRFGEIIALKHSGGQTEDRYEIRFKAPKTAVSDIVTSIRLFPNPCSDYLNVHTEGTFELFLFDMTGRLILQTEGNNSKKINLQAIPAGMYQAEIQNQDAVLSEKIVIVH